MSNRSGWKGAQHGRFQLTILFWRSIVDSLSWWHWACRSSMDLWKSHGSPSFPFFWLCNANKVSTTPCELALLQLEEQEFGYALLDQDSHWINNFHQVLFDHSPQLSNRLCRSIWKLAEYSGKHWALRRCGCLSHPNFSRILQQVFGQAMPLASNSWTREPILTY